MNLNEVIEFVEQEAECPIHEELHKEFLQIAEFLEKLKQDIINSDEKIARAYIELNNALYFSDSKKSNYHNLIYDLLDILEMKNEEVGQKYIEINNERRDNNER